MEGSKNGRQCSEAHKPAVTDTEEPDDTGLTPIPKATRILENTQMAEFGTSEKQYLSKNKQSPVLLWKFFQGPTNSRDIC